MENTENAKILEFKKVGDLKVETIESFIARGGEIEIIPPKKAA